jgi:hypothetical protein
MHLVRLSYQMWKESAPILQTIDPDVSVLESSGHYYSVLKGLGKRGDWDAVLEQCSGRMCQCSWPNIAPAMRKGDVAPSSFEPVTFAKINKWIHLAANVDKLDR